MANVELVIRIPEEDYQNILHTGKVSFRTINAIEAGIPLPKGHGRLIDADELENHLKEDADEWDEYALARVEDAPTIIEADTKVRNK